MAMAENFVRTKSGLVLRRPPIVSHDELTHSQIELAKAAHLALRNAHNSVEDIRVGAAIKTADDRVFIGANLRGSGISRHMHAEESALAAAEMSGFMDGIRAVAVVSAPYGPKLPCDTCSKMLLIRANESGIDTVIITSNVEMSRFSILKITDMFVNRNLPHGELDIDMKPDV
jgi:cytidine deaminase